MAYGLRIRDKATGAIMLDVTDSITRFLGSVTVTDTVQNGSVTHAGFADGVPWYSLLMEIPQVKLPPNVLISGNTLSWSHAESISYGRAPVGKILFGIR